MNEDRVLIVKILIKDHHDKIDDLVSRPLVRALKKVGTDSISKFIDKDGISLYCCLDNGIFYEVFTQRKLEMDDIDYEVVSSKELKDKVKSLTKEEIGMLHTLIRKFIFGENIKIDLSKFSTMEDLAKDRAILFKEYNNGLLLINPYDKDHENDYSKSLVERYNIEKEIREKISKRFN